MPYEIGVRPKLSPCQRPQWRECAAQVMARVARIDVLRCPCRAVGRLRLIAPKAKDFANQRAYKNRPPSPSAPQGGTLAQRHREGTH